MKWYSTLIGIVGIFYGLNSFAQSASCQASCPGSGIVVELKAGGESCMCLPGGTCFKVNIGKGGPQMTAGGGGTLSDARGGKYQTHAGPGTTGYDNDALSTGIAANDAVGIWIHKARGCVANGSEVTKGCIAVPCALWPEIKSHKGSSISICGGGSGKGEHMSGFMSGETDDSGFMQ